VGIVHWDEVEPRRRAKGEMDATWQRLGAAAGTEGVGVNRVRVAPGMLSTPPHSHGASEEIFFVLGGSGLAWQDEIGHEVRAGTCIVHRANEMEHTFRAGLDGLDYVVFGTNHPVELSWLPRSRAIRTGWPWVEGRDDDPWDVEAQADPLVFRDADGPAANIVHFDDAPLESGEKGSERALAAAAGSKQAGLHWLHLEPGRRGPPPHCHSEEEEVFILLEGEATLELWPSPRTLHGEQREDIPLRAGHIVARPPATRVGHAFEAGPEGVTMLVYGTRKGNDIVYYPRSRKLFWRGVGLIGRVEALEYYDGEPDET
jgi:uncharacterized cupin superfamily protein